MSLRWKSFERTAWRRVRSELRASEKLGRDYKLARKARRRRSGIRPWILRLLFLLFAAMFIGRSSLGGRGSPDFVTAVLWLWTVGSYFLRASQLTLALYYSPGLMVLSHLPISDDDVFRTQWRSFLRATRWSVFDFSLGYALLGFSLGAGWDALVAGLVLGAIQWVFIVATATCLFTYGPRRIFYLLMMLFMASAIGLAVFGSGQPALVSWVAQWAYWIPPVGWILYVMGVSSGAGLLHGLTPCVLSVAVLAAFPLAYRKIRRELALSEGILIEARRATATGEAAAPRWPEFADQFAQSPVEVQNEIASRAFLSAFDWQRAGIVDRLVARTLTPREQTIAEFLVAAQPKWTSGLRGFLMVILFLLFFAKFFTAQLQASAGVVIVVGISFLYAFSVAGWRGLKPISANGLQPPYYPFYPIGFGELMRCILKVNTCRYLLCVLILLVLMLIFTGSWQATKILTVAIVGKVFLLGLFAQPIVAIGAVSLASSDSNRLGFALLAVLFILVLVGTAAGFVLATKPAHLATSLALVGGLPVAGLFLYARRFNRCRFDLVPAKRDDF